MPYPILAPNSTWYKSSTARSTITEINIVNSYTVTGNENETWNADTDNSGSIKCYRTGTVLTIAGNGYGKVFANPDSSRTFSSSDSDLFSSLKTINGGAVLDTSKATTFLRMFDRCSALTSIDVTNWNTENVTNMERTFQVCLSLKELDLSKWNVGKVTTMQSMFMSNETFGAMSLETIGDVSGWETGNVTNMQSMFSTCTSIVELDLSGWDVGKVTNMSKMFLSTDALGAMKLTSIGNVGNWNTSKVNTMQAMFQLCSNLESLDVSNWNTGACTDMSGMFYECTSLAELDTSNWNTGACTNMQAMFYGCTSLAELDVATKVVNAGTADEYTAWDVSKVTDFCNMFYCGSNYGTTPMIISELDVSNWDTSSATDMSFMFYGVKGPKSIDVSGWDVSKVENFDHMFAHSYLTIGDTSNWYVSTACTNLNAAFHSVQNTTFNVSNFDTSNVQFFCQMFQDCYKLTEIIGLENLDTSSGLGFEEMFRYCGSIKELNLSNFDTTKAKNGVTASTNGHKTATLNSMFGSMNKLEKITLGEKFSFNGDGTNTNSANVGVLPTPSASNITGADGYWYIQNRTKYLPADIPSRTAMAYYASLSLVNNIDFLIKNGSLLDVADEIRVLYGTEDAMGLDAMAEHVGEANANINNAFTAVGNKGGTVPEYKTSGNLVSAINSIPSGGSVDIPSAATAEFGRTPIIEQAPEGKSYFNGVLLPDFPATGFESCPYLMVLFNYTSGKYYAYGSASVPYFTYRDIAESLELPSGRNRCAYDPTSDSWGEVQSSTSGTWCNLSENWRIIWSNFDIPNGSATSEDVYLEGSDPASGTPVGYGDYVSGAESYAVTDDVLNELGHRMQQHTGNYELVSGSEIREFVTHAVDDVLNPLVEKDINFWDYDGTLLYSYTLEELQELTELPPAPKPKKDFLAFGEWNWTLEQIKNLNLPVDVGATYRTVDGKTYLIVEVTEPEKMEITLNFAIWCDSMVINWGDGSEETVTYTSGESRNRTLKHTYANLGRYTITINAAGTWNAGLMSVTAPLAGVGDNDVLSGAFLREVYTGKGIRFLTNAFYRAIRLETVMLSKQATFNIDWTGVFINCHCLKAVIYPSHFPGGAGNYMQTCYSLAVLSLPYNATSVSHCSGARMKRFTASPNLKKIALGACYVKEVFLSEGVETLEENFLNGNELLSELTLPASLLTVKRQGLRGSCLSRLRFKSITPPTVANANAFNSLPASCIVEVPAESLEAYQNATNYASIAAQMVGV